MKEPPPAQDAGGSISRREKADAMKNRIFAAFLMMAALLLPTLVMAEEIEYVTFGSYEQDNDLTNGKEPIEWRVLKEEDGEAMLLSRYALDTQPYNQGRGNNIHWPECTLRAWLNNEFYNEAFSEEEQALIILKTLKNYKEIDTEDRVFLLDNFEARSLFANHADRQTSPTPYAKSKGCYMSKKYIGNVHWWLRSFSWESSRRASYVAASGGVMTCGGSSEADGAVENARWTVRPVICIRSEDLEKLRGAE